MDYEIATILFQDGIVNGAVYGLIGLSIVLVFSVTRIIFVPQGEFVTFGTLTLAMLQSGQVPGTFWLLVATSTWMMISLVVQVVRKSAQSPPLIREARTLAYCGIAPVALAGTLIFALDAPRGGLLLQVVTSIIIIVPLGPILYQTIYAPIAHASILVLLIASVAVHLILQQLGLIFFGAEGFRTPALVGFSFDIGSAHFSGAAASVVLVAAAMALVFVVVFGFTLFGKALRATAGNATGARLVGIRPKEAGTIAFGLAALLGVVSGLVIGPVTTIYYDTGFLIALKGFVAAIIGGLHSYPLTIMGSLFVGITEAFSAFSASAFRDVIVFSLLLPVLLWRSMRSPLTED